MGTCVQLHHDPTLSTLLPGGVSVQIPRTSVGREYSEVVARDGSFYNCPALSNGEHTTHIRAPAQPKTPQSLLESCTHAVYVVVGPCPFAHLALHAAGQPVQQRLQPHRMLSECPVRAQLPALPACAKGHLLAWHAPRCPHFWAVLTWLCPAEHVADSLICLGSIPPS